MIDKNIEIEDLVEQYPFSVKYLADNGIRCIACGEPIWGTLEEAAKEKNFNDTQIEHFITEMNELSNSDDPAKAYEKKIEVDKINP